MKDKIKNEIENLIYESFGIKINKLNSVESMFLLGIMPRDILKLVYLIEEKYNIRFNENDLIENRFDDIDSIVKTICKYVDKKNYP